MKKIISLLGALTALFGFSTEALASVTHHHHPTRSHSVPAHKAKALVEHHKPKAHAKARSVAVHQRGAAKSVTLVSSKKVTPVKASSQSFYAGFGHFFFGWISAPIADASVVVARGVTYATHFGYRDYHWETRRVVKHHHVSYVRVFVQDDNGIGSSMLNPLCPSRGIDTDNLTLKGVALPEHVICEALGVPPIPHHAKKSDWLAWAPARNSAIRVWKNDKTNAREIPIVDVGPSPVCEARGHCMDLTKAASLDLGGDNLYHYEFLKDYYLSHSRPTMWTAGENNVRTVAVSAAPSAKKKGLYARL